MIKAVLFDLDGTLLPMDQEVFGKAYMAGLAQKMAPYGYEPKTLVGGIWEGTKVMVQNDGSCTNEEAFWKFFEGMFGEQVKEHEPVFNDFYANEFKQAKVGCGYEPKAREVVDALKAKGCRVILATNPLFPAIATEQRISWAGLKPTDFELYTTYENSHFCKPNPKYYQEILEKLGLKPEECMMVGNDVTEDMVAEILGMKVFLLTDCLINKEEKDITKYPKGSFDELLAYIEEVV